MIKFDIEGEYCSNCMNQFVEKAGKIKGVKSISFNNITSKLDVDVEDEDKSEIITSIKQLLEKIEKTAKLVEIKNDNKDFVRKKMTLKEVFDLNKKEIVDMTLSIIIFIIATLFTKDRVKISLYLLSVVILGYGLFIDAIKNIMTKNFLDENFLMSLASICAFAIGEYVESIFVLVLFTIGGIFESLTVNNTKVSISNLMDIKQDFTNVVEDGHIKKINTSDVNIGDTIQILPGEKVPLDCVVINGMGRLDTSSITGESMTFTAQRGDKLLSGYINENGVLQAKVEKNLENSTVSKILDMVQNATEKKSEAENFITKFARYYTPSVVAISLIVAFMPPLLKMGSLNDFLYRALAFLVVSCPCAVVISVPLAYFAGLGAASKKGILIKGNNYLEALRKVGAVVFDKTGTITKGSFVISDVISVSNLTKDAILNTIAICEQNSNHPLAKSIAKGYKGEIDGGKIEDFEEVSGVGIRCKYDGKEVILGNRKIFEKYLIDDKNTINKSFDTDIYLAIDGDYKGYITLEDEIKEDSIKAITNLKNMSIRTVLLTGDKEGVAIKVSEKVGINQYKSGLLPDEKVIEFEKILSEEEKNVIFVGDGINDAPVLKRADIGVAMGGVGQDAAIEAADIVLMTDDLSKIIDSMNIANYTQKIVKQNIVFSIGVKVIIMLLSTLGLANLWLAVFGDVGVSILAIINSSKIGRKFK